MMKMEKKRNKIKIRINRMDLQKTRMKIENAR